MIITQTIHRIELSRSYDTVNVYLLTGSVITLVDAGEDTEICLTQLVEALKDHQLTISDIDQIVLTHMHEDHIGLLATLMEQSDATVHVHEKGALSFIEVGEPHTEYNRQLAYMTDCYMRWGAENLQRLWGRFYTSPIDKKRVKYLKEGDTLFAGDRLYTIMETPGHSQLDISLINEDTKTFICGDLILPDITPVTYVETPFPMQSIRPYPLIQYTESLESIPSILDLLIYPGHGEAFIGHEEWIRKRLKRMETKCEKMLHTIQQRGKVTVHDLCEELSAQHYKIIPYSILSNTVSHLELLEQRQLIKRIVDQEVDYYTLT